MKSLAYKHLETEISRRIQSGIYLPGAQLPTEKELVEEFNVSRMTVSKGLSSLIQSGTIRRIRGRGTFVTQESDQADSPYVATGFVRLLLPGEASKQPYRCNALLESISQSCQFSGLQVGVAFYRTVAEATATVRSSTDCRGLICWPINDNRFEQEINRLIASGHSVVLVDNLFHEFRGDFVGTDNFAGAETMVSQLHQLGHRRIAYLTFPYELSSLAERAAGVLGACSRLNISLKHSLGILPNRSASIQEHCNAAQLSYMREWLRKIMAMDASQRATAIFVSNDTIALELMKLMLDMGIRIPEDMSLVSFDNIDQSAWLPVPLTTLSHDFQTMGQIAGHLMSNPHRKVSCAATRQFRVIPKLVMRKSLAPVRP